MITPIAVSYLVSGLIEVFLPLIIAYFLIKRLLTSWKTWFIGALMFLVSLVRFPLNNYLTDLVISSSISSATFWFIYLIPSFTAGLFEETARYIAIQYLIKNEDYRTGLTYGAGHGGIESIFLVGINILTIGIILLTKPESLPQMQLEIILATPWYLPLVGAYERIMVMPIHISLSIMVLESIRQKKIEYLLLAVIVHTAINYLSVSAVGHSVLYAEMVVTGFAIGLSQWAYTRIKDEIMA